MGTTRDALLADDGVRLAFVLCIEGYGKLITSGDTDSAVTAWAGTLWSSALPGLQLSGNIEQSFKPFSNDLQIPTLSVIVLPDENDTFGAAVFKSKPAVSTRLTGAFQSTHGTFDMEVQDSGRFTGDGVYIGNRLYQLDGTTPYPTATTVRVQANGSGYYAPFGTNVGSANRFPGTGTAPSGESAGGWEVSQPPIVSGDRRTFVGAKCGVWVHRVVNGVWDTKDQAELIFAGTIESVNETQDGSTSLEVAGIQSAIEDTTLLSDQWTAVPKGGYRFIDGQKFGMELSIVTSTGTGSYPSASTNLTCTTGASGSDEFEPGYYSADKICGVLQTWLNADATIGGHQWAAEIQQDNQGFRFRLTCIGSTSSSHYRIHFKATEKDVLSFLGFDTTIDAAGDWSRVQGELATETTVLVSELAPLRFQRLDHTMHYARVYDLAIDLESTSGTFYDLTNDLPPHLAAHAAAGEIWSLFSIGDSFLFLARKDSDTALSSLKAGVAVGLGDTDDLSGLEGKGLRMGEDPPLIKQVALISGSFSSVLARFLCSIDGQGKNHATYDDLPFGAAIPWDLLGDNFLNSAKSLEQDSDPHLVVFIEKPTRLWDAIKSDLVLRAGWFVWKDGGLQIGSLQTPNASTADWTLTESNKAVEAGQDARTVTQHTGEFMVNNLKVEYARGLFNDKYTRTYIARDIPSIEAYGVSRPLTIKARNSYAAWSGTGQAPERLIDTITARFLPPLARPMRRYRRSMSHNLFMAVPGDTVSLTDDFVRNPTTGSRGVSARGATVIGVSWSLGVSEGVQSYNGTIDLLYTEEDRLFPVSPSAKHRDYTGGTYTNGWSSSNSRIAVENHQYSLSSESNDVSHFTAGDEVRVIEVDPADPASPDTFVDTAIGVNASTTPNYIQLTSGFGVGGRPAFDSAKTYVIVPREYSAVDAGQQVTSYMADSADGLIENLSEPNLFGSDRYLGFADAVDTDLPERHSTNWYGEGSPVHPHLMQAMARMSNNLQSYGCTTDMPFSHLITTTGIVGSTGSGTVYRLSLCFPMYIGYARFFNGGTRVLSVAPAFRSSTGAQTATVKISSSENPPSGDTWTSVTYRGSKNTLSFSTTSTAQWQQPATQDLTLLRSPMFPDITWISVEINDYVELAGISAAHMQGLA